MAENAALNVGLVGCGGLGRRHAQAIAQMPAVHLVAVCDHFRESAERLAGDLEPRPVAYGDHKEMFARERLDAVVIVTPNFTHKQITVDAASAGLHVFCEKPMALTLHECDAMIEATERAGVTLMIGYIRRFQPVFAAMKGLVDEGRLGELRFAHAVRLGTGPPGGVQGWQTRRDQYGGLFSMFSHELDQLCWYAGPVASVQATLGFGDDPHNDVEESISLGLEFASGATGFLVCSRISPVPSYEVGVAGTAGSAKIERASGPGSIRVKLWQSDKAETIECAPGDGRLGEFEHFFDCIRQGIRPGPDGIAGRHTVAVALAADESYRTGRRVKVVE